MSAPPALYDAVHIIQVMGGSGVRVVNSPDNKSCTGCVVRERSRLSVQSRKARPPNKESGVP